MFVLFSCILSLHLFQYHYAVCQLYFWQMSDVQSNYEICLCSGTCCLMTYRSVVVPYENLKISHCLQYFWYMHVLEYFWWKEYEILEYTETDLHTQIKNHVLRHLFHIFFQMTLNQKLLNFRDFVEHNPVNVKKELKRILCSQLLRMTSFNIIGIDIQFTFQDYNGIYFQVFLSVKCVILI